MKEYIVPVGDKGNMTMIENELHLQELVRCKDCEMNNQCSIQFKFANADNPGDWFCADGVRKKEF